MSNVLFAKKAKHNSGRVEDTFFLVSRIFRYLSTLFCSRPITFFLIPIRAADISVSCLPCAEGTFSAANRMQCTDCSKAAVAGDGSTPVWCPFASPLAYVAAPPPAWRHGLQSTSPLNATNLGTQQSM